MHPLNSILHKGNTGNRIHSLFITNKHIRVIVSYLAKNGSFILFGRFCALSKVFAGIIRTTTIIAREILWNFKGVSINNSSLIKTS